MALIGASSSNTPISTLGEGKGFTVLQRNINEYTGHETVFVQASASIAQYDAVWVSSNGKASSLTGDRAKTPGFVGFAQVNFADGDYGWVVVRGKVTVKGAASCNANVQLFTTNTAGVVDDATLSTSQFQIIGLIASQSATAGGATNIEAEANYPNVRRLEF